MPNETTNYRLLTHITAYKRLLPHFQKRSSKIFWLAGWRQARCREDGLAAPKPSRRRRVKPIFLNH